MKAHAATFLRLHNKIPIVLAFNRQTDRALVEIESFAIYRINYRVPVFLTEPVLG